MSFSGTDYSPLIFRPSYGPDTFCLPQSGTFDSSPVGQSLTLPFIQLVSVLTPKIKTSDFLTILSAGILRGD